MPDVSSVAALDVLIGLILVYFVLSIACSALNELLAQILNLRARDLERGIRNLLADDKGKVQELFENWRVDALVKPGWLSKRRKPSYVPSRVFALAFLDTVAPPSEGVASTDLLRRARDQVSTLPEGRVKSLLEEAIAESRGSIDRLRTELERSFNEVMDRASGWYKRRVQWILLVLAALLVGFINADTFTIAERLWKDDALRAAVVAQAETLQDQTSCETDDGQNDADTNPLDTATACIDQAKGLGIPLGWTAEPLPDDGWGWLGKFLGLAITALALSLGAPFWFDLLGKVSKLRATGPREIPTEDHQRAASAPERTGA